MSYIAGDHKDRPYAVDEMHCGQGGFCDSPCFVPLRACFSSNSIKYDDWPTTMTRKRRPLRRSSIPLPQQLPPAANPQLAAAILAVVDTQLRDGTPPETGETFERLVDLGYTLEGARQLLAHVVVREIFTVMARGESYDAARFVAALRRLPTLPADDE